MALSMVFCMLILAMSLAQAEGFSAVDFQFALAKCGSLNSNHLWNPKMGHVSAHASNQGPWHMCAQDSMERRALKQDLVRKVAEFRKIQARDGQEKIDFGMQLLYPRWFFI
jgi:hypothetical protein